MNREYCPWGPPQFFEFVCTLKTNSYRTKFSNTIKMDFIDKSGFLTLTSFTLTYNLILCTAYFLSETVTQIFFYVYCSGKSHLSVGVILPNDKQYFPISKSLLRDVTREKVSVALVPKGVETESVNLASFVEKGESQQQFTLGMGKQKIAARKYS